MKYIENLADAIINLAVSDYIKALCGHDIIESNSKIYDAEEMKEDCERFFRSEWFQLLSNGIDSEAAIKVLHERADYQKIREHHDCKRCEYESCRHKDGTHFTTILNGGQFICEREKDNN